MPAQKEMVWNNNERQPKKHEKKGSRRQGKGKVRAWVRPDDRVALGGLKRKQLD